MKVYRVLSGNCPIEISEKEALLTSKFELSYLQGLRDALGIKAILVGSDGKEIQYFEKVPIYTSFQAEEEAVKYVKK